MSMAGISHQNTSLHLLSQALEKQLEGLNVALEENSSRMGVMGEHLKNVEQEIAYTEQRVRKDTPNTRWCC